MISVIIPAFNADKHLDKCLKSVEGQTYKNIEIVIVNDGSTDSTEHICECHSREDNRIVLINTENKGVSNARNCGIRQAKGDYLCFVDADDYIDEEYLEKYILIAKNTNADIVIGGAIEEYNNRRKVLTNRGNNVVFEGENIQKLIYSILDNKSDMDENYYPQVLGFSPCKLIKKDIAKSTCFPVGLPIREDAIYVLQLLLVARRIVITGISGYHYVISDTSATGRFRKNYSKEAEQYLEYCENIWDNNQLDKNSFYIGCLFTYMTWIKSDVMHVDSNYSFLEKIEMIKNSFKNKKWVERFESVNTNTLSWQYKILKILYCKKSAFSIYCLNTANKIRRNK